MCVWERVLCRFLGSCSYMRGGQPSNTGGRHLPTRRRETSGVTEQRSERAVRRAGGGGRTICGGRVGDGGKGSEPREEEGLPKRDKGRRSNLRSVSEKKPIDPSPPLSPTTTYPLHLISPCPFLQVSGVLSSVSPPLTTHLSPPATTPKKEHLTNRTMSYMSPPPTPPHTTPLNSAPPTPSAAQSSFRLPAQPTILLKAPSEETIARLRQLAPYYWSHPQTTNCAIREYSSSSLSGFFTREISAAGPPFVVCISLRTY